MENTRRELWPHYLPPVFAIFFAFWRPQFENEPSVNENVVRGRFGQTEILKTRNEGKHYKIRDFKSLHRLKKAGQKEPTKN